MKIDAQSLKPIAWGPSTLATNANAQDGGDEDADGVVPGVPPVALDGAITEQRQLATHPRPLMKRLQA
jgi:hypothetical protein